jgi:hypothetical protein
MDFTGAVDTSQWALGITSKHTPTNHTAISLQYSRLATAYQASKAWREAGYCLTKAIEANLELIKKVVDEEVESFLIYFSSRNQIIDNT